MSFTEKRTILGLGLGLGFLVAGFACSTSDTSGTGQAAQANGTSDGGAAETGADATSATGEAIRSAAPTVSREPERSGRCRPGRFAHGCLARAGGAEGTAAADRRTPALAAAAAGLRRGGLAEPAVPVLPARERRASSRNVVLKASPGRQRSSCMKTATGGNCGLPTIGAVRLALEPKPGLPTDPNDVRAFIDVFTDISRALRHQQRERLVRRLDDPRRRRADGRRAATRRPRAVRDDDRGRTPTCSRRWAPATTSPATRSRSDGNAVTLPSASDQFPEQPDQRRADAAEHGRLQRAPADATPHLLGVQLHDELGASALRAAVHRRLLGTTSRQPPDALEDGAIGQLSSIVPGSGPLGVKNAPRSLRRQPEQPARSGSLRCARHRRQGRRGLDTQREFRLRFIPSGLANEILLDVYVRRASFQTPGRRPRPAAVPRVRRGGRAGRHGRRRRHLRGRG